jgi:hypothetical protein
MSDYYPLLSRMVAGLPTNNGESRRALYARARVALCDQLRGREPPFTNSEITRERLSLEAAIRKFEADAIRKPHELLSPDPAAVPTDFGPAAAVRVSAAPVERSQAPPPVSPAWRPNGVAPREQLVEPAAVAQLVGAREGVGSTPRGNGREGEGRNSDTRTRAYGPAVLQPGPPSQPPSPPSADTELAPRPLDDAIARLGRRVLPDAERRTDWLTPLLGALYVVLGFAQLVAFFHGLQTWFGLGGVASIGIFMLLNLTGSPGSIPMAVVAFYGAWRGWQWPMLGAALLALSFVILSFGFLGVGGVYQFFNRQKPAPLAELIRSLARSPWWRKRAHRWRVAWNHDRRVRVRAPRYRGGGGRAEKFTVPDDGEVG